MYNVKLQLYDYWRRLEVRRHRDLDLSAEWNCGYEKTD